jgi:ubiquinone/menaquinone biosynthesis C-methylase UbiE
MVEMDNPLAKENRSATIIGHLDLDNAINIADIGCGPGRVTIPLAKKLKPGSTLVAIDIQNEMLKKVKRKATDMDNIKFRQGALGDGILEKDKYDYILLVNMLGEMPKAHNALEESFNALKPGGILSITETVFDPHYQRISTLEKITSKIGFQKKQFFGKWYSYTVHFIAKK